MCDKIEAYAKEYAKEQAIYAVIEAFEKINLSQEEIVKAIMNQFNLTDEEAKEYYDEVC